MKEGYLPKDERKTILLIGDDLRVFSGIGTQSKELVFNTCHRFNWIQISATINHPEKGKIVDVSEAVAKETGVPDAFVRLYPFDNYGDPNIIRFILSQNKVDAMIIFSDPRFYEYLFRLMESEIRERIPLLYWTIWDAGWPYPMYNRNFYRSCDALFCISKQTYNVVKQVCKDDDLKPWQLTYLPHGVDTNIFKKLDTTESIMQMEEMRKTLFGNDEVDFVVLYDSRNIRRKTPGNVVLSYQKFLKSLPQEKADKCRLLLHTDKVDPNGTDLPRLINEVAPEIKYKFTDNKYHPLQMNVVYNICDVIVSASSAEGFGLASLNMIAAERLMIAPAHGGLADQMQFTTDDGELLDINKHYNYKWSNNIDGKYKKHGSWAFPYYVSATELTGSPPTPYIFNYFGKWEEAADRIMEVYNLSKEEREERGKKGREFVLGSAKMSANQLGIDFIQQAEEVFKNWTPRKRFVLEKI